MTSLQKKTRLKAGYRAWNIHYSGKYSDFFDEITEDIEWHTRTPRKEVNFVHLFVSCLSDLEHDYFKARDAIAKDDMLWISWPKGNKTIDINRDRIREYGLANGLVDANVASVNDFWSGLKFVYRLKDR